MNNLFNEITAQLKNSGRTWSELNTTLGNKNKSTLQQRMKRNINFINSVINIFGFELSIKRRKAKLTDTEFDKLYPKFNKYDGLL